MLVRILDSAHNDIRDGYWFYASQGPGVGDYFSDTLYGEIESLALYAGIHNKRFEKQPGTVHEAVYLTPSSQSTRSQ